MSEFEKHFPKPVAKDNPHFHRQIQKWKTRREGALWALKWAKGQGCVPPYILEQEIAELENETT